MREGRPSATALLIPQAMAMQARDPERLRLIPPDAAAVWDRFLAAADPGRSRLVRWAGGGARALAHLGEQAVIPGVQRYLAPAVWRTGAWPSGST